MSTKFEIDSVVWNRLKDHLIWLSNMPTNPNSTDPYLDFDPGDHFTENSNDYQNTMICKYMPEVCEFFVKNDYCWNFFKLDLDNQQIIGSIFDHEYESVDDVFILTSKLP